MIIYRDCISQDEMFSDIYKIKEVANGLCLEVEGKLEGLSIENCLKSLKEILQILPFSKFERTTSV